MKFLNPDNLPPPPRSLMVSMAVSFEHVAKLLRAAENMGDLKAAGCLAYDRTEDLDQLINEYAVRRRAQLAWKKNRYESVDSQ